MRGLVNYFGIVLRIIGSGLFQIIVERRKPMINKKDMPLCEAANYFKEEILEIMPDIPVTQLADMVSLYIYYQYGITREEAKKVIEKTCL
jgi:hypothetical protein